MPLKNSNKKVLLIVQNNSFPFDKRVFKEAQSLRKYGYIVTVISPTSSFDKEKRVTFEEIEVVRYKSSVSRGNILSYLNEFFFSVLKIHFIFLKLHLQKHFAVVHTANPPDLFWPIALICKITGAKFIYDQHDLSPEIYHNKYGKKGLLYSILSLNEKLSVLLSDSVILVNQSFKNRLEKKWGCKDKYVIVYNSTANDFEPKKNENLVKKYSGKKIILYIGLMTKNDNIEIIIDAADKIINKKKRQDCYFILLGSGDVENAMKTESVRRGLKNFIEFKGYVEQNIVMEYLHIADIGIAPDLPNGLNEYLTLVKILEYMKAGKPFVAFKLPETMNMANGCGLFSESINEFVDNILSLLDNNESAKLLGEKGKILVNEKYLWSYSEKVLIDVYKNLLT